MPEHDGPTGATFIPEREHNAYLCMAIAEGRTDEFERLYRRTAWRDVKRMQTLKAAVNWRQPDGKDTTDPD